jgi:hypothetical protein
MILDLKMNNEKTKVMETLESDTKTLKINNYTFKTIETFKQLGVNLN